MARQPKTLMELMYVRSEGSAFSRFKETGRVFSLITLWSMAQVDLDTNDVAMEQFKEWAADMQSASTTERQMRSFRSIFKGEQNPNRIAQSLRRQAEKSGGELDATMPVTDSLLLA